MYLFNIEKLNFKIITKNSLFQAKKCYLQIQITTKNHSQIWLAQLDSQSRFS